MNVQSKTLLTLLLAALLGSVSFTAEAGGKSALLRVSFEGDGASGPQVTIDAGAYTETFKVRNRGRKVVAPTGAELFESMTNPGLFFDSLQSKDKPDGCLMSLTDSVVVHPGWSVQTYDTTVVMVGSFTATHVDTEEYEFIINFFGTRTLPSEFPPSDFDEYAMNKWNVRGGPTGRKNRCDTGDITVFEPTTLVIENCDGPSGCP